MSIRVNKRADILAREGLTWAPLQVQRAFWQRYNTRRRPGARPIGVAARALLAGRAFRDAVRLGAVREAWAQVAPPSLLPHCEPVMLRSGRLTVMVDDPGVRFVLERQLGAALLGALQAIRGCGNVRRIVYQVGPLAGEPVPTKE
jgi:hypothetical protein